MLRTDFELFRSVQQRNNTDWCKARVCRTCLVDIPSFECAWMVWNTLFFLSMVSDSFSWTIPTACKRSIFFWEHTPVPTYWCQTMSMCEGLDFLEPKKRYNRTKVHWKNGVDGRDFLENAGCDLSHVCNFVKATPSFHPVSKKSQPSTPPP